MHCKSASPFQPAIPLRWRTIAPLVVTGWACLVGAPRRAVAVPNNTPHTGIVDEAGIVDAKTQSAINALLLQLEQSGLGQMRVLTIPTTGGRDIHDYAMEVARNWQLGDRKKDNGILMVVAYNDRKYRVITGEGIESALPDLYLDRTARELLVPRFKQGDYAGGIYYLVEAIAQRVASEAGVTLNAGYSPPVVKYRTRRGGAPAVGACVQMCFMVFIMVIVIGLAISRRRLAYGRGYRSGFGGSPGGFLTGMILGSMLGGGRRHGGGWGSGGGFGGGGFGSGFGGGGGGSFGGGGAGGSW